MNLPGLSSDQANRIVWLNSFSIVVALCAFLLIFVGGLVTSHEAGLAVPDWPTSFGYNMFLFPWNRMVGGIFYEHTHRLIGSLLGILMIILTFWVYGTISDKKIRLLTLLTLALIIVQGILGGLRVELVFRPIAIVHAALAQVIFCLLLSIALFTSRFWNRTLSATPGPARLIKTITITVMVIFVQLLLGAIMRHTGSGLAIPDFPLMYGRWIPPLTSHALELANQQRIWNPELEPVRMGQILIHLAHRVGAVAVVFCTCWTFHGVWSQVKMNRIHRLAWICVSLVGIQFCLGVFVIWTGKAADIATTHVAVGALTLAAHFFLLLFSLKWIDSTPSLPSRSSFPLHEEQC